MALVTPLDDQRRYAKAGSMVCTARQSTCFTALVGPRLGTFPKFLVSFESDQKKNDERGSSKVLGILGELQLSRTLDWWWMKSSTTYTQWESLRGSSRSLHGGVRKEPTPWSYTSDRITRRESWVSELTNFRCCTRYKQGRAHQKYPSQPGHELPSSIPARARVNIWVHHLFYPQRLPLRHNQSKLSASRLHHQGRG